MSTNLYGIYFKWPKEAICFNFKIVNIQTMCWGWIWWGSYPLTLSQNGSPASICWLNSYQRAISRENFDIGLHKSFNEMLRLMIIISDKSTLVIFTKVTYNKRHKISIWIILGRKLFQILPYSSQSDCCVRPFHVLHSI